MNRELAFAIALFVFAVIVYCKVSQAIQMPSFVSNYFASPAPVECKVIDIATVRYPF
jgi:hypothetical protein